MHKMIHRMIWLLTCLIAIGLVIFQITKPISNEVMLSILKDDQVTYVAFVFIALFILYCIYRDLLKGVHELLWTLQYTLMFILSMMMLARFTLPFLDEVLIYSAGIRILAIMLLIVITENYMDEDKHINLRLIVIIGIMSSLVILCFYNIAYLPFVLSVYYGFGIVYMSTSYYKNGLKHKESVSAFVYPLIIFALIYDLTMLTFSIDSFEVSFLVVAVSIVVIQCGKLINKYSQYNKVIIENSELIKENKKLKKAYNKSQEAVDLVKTDLSFKFVRKQHYFENLEIAVEVLEGSIIIIDDKFKVAFAHGSLLDDSQHEDIIGLDVSEAIFDLSSDEGQYFKSVVIKIFNAVDDVREQLYISLLDKQLNINNVFYDMQYNVLRKRDGRKVLVLQADMVSELSQQGVIQAREKEIFQMVITVAKQGEIFFHDLATYLYFAKTVDRFFDKEASVHDKIYKYLKRLHTFKGVFDHYNMQSTVKGIDDVENELLNMLHHSKEITDGNIDQTLMSYDLEGLIQVDLEIIKEKLGQMYLENKKKISIDMVKYNRLIDRLKEEIKPDHKIISAFEQLAYVDVRDVLISYKDYVMRIAKEQGKKINFEVSGDSVMLKREPYTHFFENLIHLFKNSVIHGLEYPDERLAAHKNEVGNISCHIKNLDNTMVLKISDDGRGVDIKEIKNKLFISGKYMMEELENLSDEFVSNLILDDGVSVGEYLGEYAGKGVGMSCIKEVVEALDGQASVHSTAGKGVTYELKFSIEVDNKVKLFDTMAILKKFTLETEKVLTKNNSKTKISNNWVLEKGVCSTEMLLEASAHLVVQGMADTYVCVSADEKMLKHLMDYYGLYGKYKGLSVKTINEALSLFAYSITKRTVEVLQAEKQSIEITSPSLMTNLSFEALYSGRQAAISKMAVDEGELTIIILSAKVRRGE